MLRKISVAIKVLRQYNKVKDTMDAVEKRGKAWYKSKTVWVNIIALVAIIASYFGLDITEEEQLAIATAILAIVNIALRFVTKEPVYIRRPGHTRQQTTKANEQQIDTQDSVANTKTGVEIDNKERRKSQSVVAQQNTDDDDLI